MCLWLINNNEEEEEKDNDITGTNSMWRKLTNIVSFFFLYSKSIKQVLFPLQMK